MNNLINGFSLTGINGIGLFIVLGGISIVAVYLFYRNIFPPQSRFLRIILRSLRLVTLLIISMQAAVFVIEWNEYSTEKKVIGLLLDGSRSTQLGGGASFDSLLNMVDRLASTIEKKAQVKKYIFDSGLREFNLDAEANGDLTDISNSLSEFEREMRWSNVSGLLLFSDGQSNQGKSPELYSRTYPYPIYSVGLGGTRTISDVRIVSVEAAPIMFSGDSSRISVRISSEGFAGERTEVRLTGDGIKKRKRVMLPQDGFMKNVEFDVSFEGEGERTLTAYITPLPKELTELNNSRLISINVLSKKKDVLMLAGAPSADYVFIKNLLEEREDFNLTSMVQSPDGGWYEGGGLDLNSEKEYDVMIFVGFPAKQTQDKDLRYLIDRISKSRTAIFFIESPNADYSLLSRFNRFLPVKFPSGITNRVYSEAALKLTEEGKSHPFTRQSEFTEESSILWDALPPAQLPVPSIRAGTNSTILLSAKSRNVSGVNEVPVLIVKEGTDGKSAVLTAVDSYTLHFLQIGVGDMSSTWKKTLTQGVEWLATSQELNRVNLRTDKKIYAQGERVRFRGRVYDSSYKPVRDALLQVKIIPEGSAVTEYSFDMNLTPSGNYAGEFISIVPGSFNYIAQATRGDLRLGEFRGSFIYEPFSPELNTFQRNDALLSSIALNTNGSYVPIESFRLDSLHLDLESYSEASKASFDLWNNTYLLIILLILLAAEWTLRRLNGLL